MENSSQSSAPVVVRTLPSNRMVREARRDMDLAQRFATDLEGLMSEYGLSDEEKNAFRAQDLKKMLGLGVHPYFLTQITRLFHGSANNHQGSAAIQAYRKSLIDNQD